MTVPLWCLLGFASWTLVLLLGIAVFRVTQVMTGQKKPTEFPAGVPHGGDLYWRLNRAHLNCTENLPIFGAVVAVGTLAGVTWPLFGLLSQVYLGARVVQSLIHVASGSTVAVNARFAAFIVQACCLVRMIWMITDLYSGIKPL